MDGKIIAGLIGMFLGGAAISGFVTFKVTEKKLEEKYKKIADEEVKSVKEKFTVPKTEARKFIDSKRNEDVAKQAVNKPNIHTYASTIKNYTNYSNVEYEPEHSHFEPEDQRKEVINPDEYGEDENYEQVSLTYYSDGILADEDDTILNISEVIGDEALDHIGDYEDDAVHVKNYGRKVYYEVITDKRTYLDVTGKEADDDYDLYRRLGKDNKD